MAGPDTLEVRYTTTVADKIDVLSWWPTAFPLIKPQGSFRTPLPFYVRLSFIGFLIGCAVPVVSVLLFDALAPDAPAGFFSVYYVGLAVGSLVTLLGFALPKLSRGSAKRAVETFLMRANGGRHEADRPGTATFSETGLRFEGSDCTQFFQWSQLSSFVDQRSRLVFVFRSCQVAWLPKVSLSDDECRAVVSWVERFAPGVGSTPTPPRDSDSGRTRAA